MTRRVAIVPLLVASLLAIVGFRAPGDGPRPTEPGTAKNFKLIGHDPLYNRGMNAAPAMYRHYLYIGNRTDGSPHHLHPGVLVVDVADPAKPAVVGEIGFPDEGNVAETSRELRVWPQQKVLLVMNFSCSALLHACTSPADAVGSLDPNISFYDLSDPANPKLVTTYSPPRTPHEMFLWVDPADKDRALLYMSTPTTSTDNPNLIVTDISRWRKGKFNEIVEWKSTSLFPPKELDTRDVRLHTMNLTADGTRAYLAYLGAGPLVLDTSEVADGVAKPKVKLLTPPTNAPRWENMTAHTFIPIPGRNYALATDEVYGDALDPIVRPENEFGCPWGWAHMIDTSNLAHLRIAGQFQAFENHNSYCNGEDGRDPGNTYFTAYSAHNPTVLSDLAFVAWHSDGLEAIDITNPRHPSQAGFYSPEPEPFVVTEDPALSQGENKVVMWSYPIIRDGLIYVVDVRNGLYVLKYTGSGRDAVDDITFLEGNSNLGDALRLERSG